MPLLTEFKESSAVGSTTISRLTALPHAPYSNLQILVAWDLEIGETAANHPPPWRGNEEYNFAEFRVFGKIE